MKTYAERVTELEAEGLTRSDAQGCADVEAMKGLIQSDRPTMKTEKHTPGPWYFETDGDGPKQYWDKYICADNGGGRVCTLHLPNSGEQQEVKANGAFIVRACNSHYELVGALKAIANHFADVMGGPMVAGRGIVFENGVEGIPTIAMARAAITKAERGAE